MRRLLKYSCLVVLLMSVVGLESCRHRGAEPKDHQRMWRKWSKKSDAFNPYVKHDKSTHEISRREKREDDKAILKAKKEYKKSIRRSARKRRGK